MKTALWFQSSLFTLLVGGTAGWVTPHEKCIDQLDYDAFEGSFFGIDDTCFFGTDDWSAPCHPSCKSCIYGPGWQGDGEDGLGTGGFGNRCFRCTDGSDVLWPVPVGDRIPIGYCSTDSSCASQTQALDVCLASNEAVCPTKEWLISASNPRFPFIEDFRGWYDTTYPAGLTESDMRLSNYDVMNFVRDVQRRLCYGIVAMTLGLTLSQSGYPDCPCAPQLYEQLYCYESDSIEFLSKDERLLDGKTIVPGMFPATPSDPMQEVCAGYKLPTCTVVDVDPSLEGCLTPECTVLPDCQCTKKCKTCGWWNSLDEVTYDDGSTLAGNELTSCTSCHNGVDVGAFYFSTNGAGDCYGSAASALSTLGAMLCSVGMLVVAVLLNE